MGSSRKVFVIALSFFLLVVGGNVYVNAGSSIVGGASSGAISSSTCLNDNDIIRTDGTAGTGLQCTGVSYSDTDVMTFPAGASIAIPGTFTVSAAGAVDAASTGTFGGTIETDKAYGDTDVMWLAQDSGQTRAAIINYNGGTTGQFMTYGAGTAMGSMFANNGFYLQGASGYELYLQAQSANVNLIGSSVISQAPVEIDFAAGSDADLLRLQDSNENRFAITNGGGSGAKLTFYNSGNTMMLLSVDATRSLFDHATNVNSDYNLAGTGDVTFNLGDDFIIAGGDDATINPADSVTILGSYPVLSVEFSASQAEVNAGKTILANTSGRQLRVLGVRARVSGTFITCTSVDIQENDNSPVVWTFAAAALVDTAVITEFTSSAVGAGAYIDLTDGQGIEIIKNGSDCAGGTSISGTVLYTVK